MSWKDARNFLLALPLVAVAYLSLLHVLLASVAVSSPWASILKVQVDALGQIVATPGGAVYLLVACLIWTILIRITETLNKRAAINRTRRVLLADRARVCAENILRYTVMRRQRDAIATKFAGVTEGDLTAFTATASLMGEFEILWSSQAIAILDEAINMGLEVDDELIKSAKHPADPSEIERLAKKLTVIAGKLEKD